jgi:hypothetical protein
MIWIEENRCHEEELMNTDQLKAKMDTVQR